MKYLKPLRPFLAWSQLSIPTVYDDSLSYYEVLNKCIFHFNEMLKTMQENYEIIDEAFAKILEECEAAIARCEEAAARAEAAQSAAEKAQAAAEAAQAAAEAAQKLAEAAQAAAEAARDDAVTAQKAAEAAQAAAEAAQAAAEAAQKKAETAQAAAEAAQSKAEDAQEKAESARDAAQAAQTAAEAAQQKAEEAKTAAESARDAAEAAQRGAEAAQEAAEASEQAAADSAADAAASAEEIKNALDNYLPLSGGTMTGKINVADELNDTFTGLSKGNYVTTINENSDLNNVKTNSINFYPPKVAISEESKNFPVKISGFLVSIVKDESTYIRQIYFSTPYNDIYTRIYKSSSNSWSNWNKILFETDIVGNYLPLSGGTMTGKINVQDEWTDTFTGLSKGNYTAIINENSDLNDVKTNCINFYPTSVVTSEESKNFPTKSSGFLVSLCRDSLTYIRQIYYLTIYNDIYTRIYNSNSSSWSNWEKILFETDIVGNYLPLSGGTMTGNITMSDNTKLIGNAETSDFFKLIHIPNASDMNKIIGSGFYAISSGDSVSNAPEEISAENNAFSCFVFPWQYPNTAGISQLIFSGDGTTVKGVYLRLTNNPEVGWGDWVRLDNVNNDNNDNDNIIMSTSSNFRYRIKNYENNFQHIEMWISQATLTGRAISPNKVLTESYSMKIGDDILDLININFNHSATIVPIQTSNDNVRGFCYTLIENDNLVFYSTFISSSTNDESFSYYFYNCKVVDLVDNRKP